MQDFCNCVIMSQWVKMGLMMGQYEPKWLSASVNGLPGAIIPNQLLFRNVKKCYNMIYSISMIRHLTC
jgi:hypothetical protein